MSKMTFFILKLKNNNYLKMFIKSILKNNNF